MAHRASEATPAETPRERRRLALVLVVWSAVLLAGFVLVFVGGQPLPSVADELRAAYTLTPPVDESRAVASAETIVRLEFPRYLGAQRSIIRRSYFDEEVYVISYSHPERNEGVRITIGVDNGRVRATTFP